LENKVKSKKVIVESLKKTVVNENKETILLPLSSMVRVANKSIEEFVSNLNESEKKELNLLLKEDESILVERFQNLKDEAVVKLVVVLESESDDLVKNTINETIDNIKSKKFDRLEYFKLKNLVDTL
jgi:hypothetical protein